MRAPLQGRREDARRLAARLRELARGGGTRPAAAPVPAPPAPGPARSGEAEDRAARLDGARQRLRASIAPPQDDDEA